MHVWALLLLLAAPFWEKAPAGWTRLELSEIRRQSPWARPAMAIGPIGGTGVATYLATAQPIRDAEAEMARRANIKPEENPLADYYEFLDQNKGKVVVLAIYFPDWAQLSDGKEVKQMEENCLMRVGKKKLHMTGHFSPTVHDPYLRLIFPRELSVKDKSIAFELYLPGVVGSYREVEYGIGDLVYKGKPEL